MLAHQIFQFLNVVVCCLGCRDKALNVIYISNQAALDCLFFTFTFNTVLSSICCASSAHFSASGPS